jgi:UDP-N-acetylmuramoyl-tripeptide--D-alanyl-D-alanine ligase
MDLKSLYSLFLQSSCICTDTRKIEPNCLFFALRGDNFNGNMFALQALEKGAHYCIVDERQYENDRCILVDDVLQTLQQLAIHHRKQLNIPIIALTGSNGKTTTKELINAVLSTKFKTTATQGNLNNHIGVPLTLLKMTGDTEIGIVEMGANHQKEIEFLTNIALPDYGLITNFGKAHLEGFGSVEGVIKGKSELYDYLKAHDKLIFVNENDPIQVKQTLGYKNMYKFGSTNTSDSKIEIVSTQPYVTLSYKNNLIKSQLTGTYNFNNIAVAIAIGNYFKVDLNHIISAIENYIPTNNRSQIIEKGTNTIIMDAYNANPTSMIAALENFKQLEKDDKILFLGDMFELGTSADEEHQNIVNYLETHNLGRTYLTGKNFYRTKVKGNHISKFETFDDLKSELQQTTLTHKLIVIKGSRGMALERILDLL